MDPVACLNDAEELLKSSGEREECAVALANYALWRFKGGFRPNGGDHRFESLLRQLGEVADTLSETLETNAASECPKVRIEVLGGVADYETEGNVEVTLIDHDNEVRCQRCGSELYDVDGHCRDETCPFSDRTQDETFIEA